MQFDLEKDLKIERVIDVPRAKVWACWTMSAHIPHFFVPKPHRVTYCDIELKVGGHFNTAFEVDGQEIKNNGIYLEIINQEKLVFTDTYTDGWKPTENPFMTAIISLQDLGNGQTKLTAIARHRTADARQHHENMGFYMGWNIVIDQLEEYGKHL